MKKLFIVLAFILGTTIGKSQTTGDDFAKYATAQDKLITEAYHHKDANAADKYMSELLTKYNAQSNEIKEDYKDAISGAYYNLACTYAISGNKKKAIDNLEKSQYYNYDHLLEDADMNPLRKDPRFIKFLAVAKSKKVDHLATLQKAPKYNVNEKSNLPEFTYQSGKDPHLRALKKTYNLDSIAGGGDDVAQMINLMRWVHNLIRHDGSKGNPDIKNAMSLISVCKSDNKTLNCRGLAILLNEVYLAEGFKSRFVTCLPKDSTDNDCHVITMVYSDDHKKWIWMDPTFNAYVMDEKGELLGIEEVRERLISKKPLLLNPDADHNHQNTQSKKYYLEYYMAKNLYYLECPVRSEYNYETQEEGKERAYIQLTPGTAIHEPKVSKNKHGNTVHSTTYTCNSKAFWQVPPGQTKADFEATVSKFQKFYNARQADSLCEIYSYGWGEYRKTMWDSKKIDDLIEEYGEMQSFKYMGIEPEDGVALFKVVFTKSTHAMGIGLDRENMLGTFRFKTSSGFINNLLAKN